MKERRKNQRLRTFLGGRIAFNNRTSTMDCLVRNLSQNGAKLAFPGPVVLPSEFDIHILDKGESRKGRLIWYNDGHVGVTLTQPDFGSVVSIETARRIRKLEADRDALARRVAELSEPM
jgi:PilZ domain